MARIRTIKPDFFRHEQLQDLEAAHPGQHLMLVFAGLWGHCDKCGRFRWKVRNLKLDILPFLDFDLGVSLVLLGEAGLIKQYESGGELYGFIPTFAEHQRITGKEAQAPAKYPEPNDNFTAFSPGKNRETPETHPGAQEGKGREGKKSSDSSLRSESGGPSPPPHEKDLQAIPDFLDRKKTPRTTEADLFKRGKEVLGQTAGGLINKVLQAKEGNVALARAAIETASTKENPREWLGGVIRGATVTALRNEPKRSAPAIGSPEAAEADRALGLLPEKGS